jgi:hypothetical protein
MAPEDDAGMPDEGCGDTRSDPENCGSCGHVCSAPHAASDCQAGTCRLAGCDPGHANCDGRPENGCETPLGSAQNCGACGDVCGASGDGISACHAGSCRALRVVVGPAQPVGPLNGSLGGDVYTRVCPSGEVLVGLELGIQNAVTYGFKAKCAPISLEGSWDAPRIAVGEAHALEPSVGGFEPANTALSIAPADCPPDTVVTATSGQLIMFSGETRMFIKTLLLACSRVGRVSADGLVFVPEKLVPEGNSAVPGEAYSDSCEPGQAVTGFTGYAGAAVDGLQTQCSSVTLEELAATPTLPP